MRDLLSRLICVTFGHDMQSYGEYQVFCVRRACRRKYWRHHP